MPRLIDADELYVDARCGENEEPYISLYQINDAPTVDAVEVVRCRDCKFWHTEGQYCDRHGVLWKEFYTSPNDYCSHGERREDAKTN